MTGEYRFLKTRGRITGFAVVGVRSRPNETWMTIFGPELTSYVLAEYGDALRSGIAVAANAHIRRGGVPQMVEVITVLESRVDTRPDAIRSAAALASWKSWNHSEAGGLIVFADEEWTISFADACE
jgi:hypothetical protein